MYHPLPELVYRTHQRIQNLTTLNPIQLFILFHKSSSKPQIHKDLLEFEREMTGWWVSMPKIELHAHLNGSIRDSTLLELARNLGEESAIVFSEVEDAILKSDRSLTEVFKLFDLIRTVATEHKTITRITKEVIEDFAAENVVYLELRTTPKRDDSRGMSKRSYMEAVFEGLSSVSAVEVDFAPASLGKGNLVNSCPINDILNGTTTKKIYVRLILCIDRHETTASAVETVELALELRHLGIVGLDLCGNPTVGDWDTFLPAFKLAREQGFPITLHCFEAPKPKEIKAMLDFIPERIGHACYFGEEDWASLKSSKIPVEICLTSNMRTGLISSIDIHHFVDLYNEQHPIILCTDDAGVFSTSLTREYILASSTFVIGKGEMFKIVRNAIEFIFAENLVKEKLREIYDSVASDFTI